MIPSLSTPTVGRLVHHAEVIVLKDNLEIQLCALHLEEVLEGARELAIGLGLVFRRTAAGARLAR